MTAPKKKPEAPKTPEAPKPPETPKIPELIKMWKGSEKSVEIMETDLKLWEAKGYSKEKPEIPMSINERMALNRIMGALNQ